MSTYYNGFLEEAKKLGKQSLEREDYDKAEKYSTLVMEIYEEGAKRDPDGWEHNLPIGYANLGNVYRKKGDNDKAEFYLQKAVKTTKELIEKCPEKYSVIGMLNILDTLAGFYMSTNQIDKAKTTYREIVKALDEIINYYHIRSEFDKAEKYCLSKVDLFEVVAKVFPNEFLGDLANGYKILVSIYGTTMNTQKCISYLNKALPLFEVLAKQNAEKYSPSLAVLCLNAFELTSDISWVKKAQYYASINPENIESVLVIDMIKGLISE